MKITVDIEEFYLEQDDIEQSLKTFVINECVSKITQSIEKKIEYQIKLTVEHMLEKAMLQKITAKVDTFLVEGKVKSRRNSSEQVDIMKAVEEEFEYGSGWNTIKENIAKQAKTFADELRRKNDLLFASQIVAKLNENGMLKENVAKMLLETIDKK